LHAQVTEELQSPNGSMETVTELISHDPVMSAKILQVVNSAFFGRAREVTDTSEAVMVLGSERIRSLILLAGVFSQYDGSKCPGFAPEPIWSHSVQVGIYARAIAYSETKDARIAEAAFTAGLLHDIGKLILAGNLPDMCAAVRRAQANRKTSQRDAELMIMGVTHAELGACLLATWGLPLTILEAIAWHHEPNKSTEKGFSLLAAVHAANVFAQAGGAEAWNAIDQAFLKKIGLADRGERWRSFCGFEVASTKEEKKANDEQLRRRREVKEN
jgi:putative nucleotidyltransferase with HDIG domain